MSKLKHALIFLAALLPITASKVNAQTFIDLPGLMQWQIIHDMEQNGNYKKPFAVKYRSSYPPDFIKALQQCNNRRIYSFIDVQRVTENVDFDHPLLLRRARECGAISSARLEELLHYQRRYYDVDKPDMINNIRRLEPDGANLVDPPRR